MPSSPPPLLLAPSKTPTTTVVSTVPPNLIKQYHNMAAMSLSPERPVVPKKLDKQGLPVTPPRSSSPPVSPRDCSASICSVASSDQDSETSYRNFGADLDGSLFLVGVKGGAGSLATSSIGKRSNKTILLRHRTCTSTTSSIYSPPTLLSSPVTSSSPLAPKSSLRTSRLTRPAAPYALALPVYLAALASTTLPSNEIDLLWGLAGAPEYSQPPMWAFPGQDEDGAKTTGSGAAVPSVVVWFPGSAPASETGGSEVLPVGVEVRFVYGRKHAKGRKQALKLGQRDPTLKKPRWAGMTFEVYKRERAEREEARRSQREREVKRLEEAERRRMEKEREGKVGRVVWSFVCEFVGAPAKGSLVF